MASHAPPTLPRQMPRPPHSKACTPGNALRVVHGNARSQAGLPGPLGCAGPLALPHRRPRANLPARAGPLSAAAARSSSPPHHSAPPLAKSGGGGGGRASSAGRAGAGAEGGGGGAGSDDDDEVFEQILRTRKIKRTVLTGFTFALGTSLGAAAALGLLPEVDGAGGALSALALAVGAGWGGAVLARSLLGEVVPWEVVGGWRIFPQWDAPRVGPPLASSAVEVRPSPGKGNGAFAASPIPAGTWMGDYEGDLLSEREFWRRYPGGVSDYVMGVDGTSWSIDGASLAPDTSRFRLAHVNHAREPNLSRQTWRGDRRVAFFAARDIAVGEELTVDYGRLYWTGREEMEV